MEDGSRGTSEGGGRGDVGVGVGAGIGEVRVCVSERMMAGKGDTIVAVLDAEGTSFVIGLGLGFDFAVVVGMGSRRSLGGGRGSAERPQGGETETSDRRRVPSEPESAACSREYIGGGTAGQCS
jgi:hypothetical protein